MADRDVLELANDEEFGDGGMDDMDGEVGLLSLFAIQDHHSFLKNCHCCPLDTSELFVQAAHLG